MRLIGTLPTESDANRLGDYLFAIGYANHTEAGRDGAWQVWIEHDDHVDQATAQLHAYLGNPSDPKFSAAAADADRLRREAVAEAEKRRRNHVDVRTTWSGLKARPTPVAIALVIACLIVGLLTGFSMSGSAFRDEDTKQTDSEARREQTLEALRFQPSYALMNPAEPSQFRPGIGHGKPRTMFSSIAAGQLWRLVTPIFLHGDILHLLFNLLWLVSLARMIEMRKGSLFLLFFVIASAVVSNTGEAMWAVYGPGSGGFEMFGGFSGVNYALFGYAWMKGKYQPYELIGVNQQTIGAMLGWLVLCVLHIIPNVANAAHVAGLIAGVAVGYAPTLRRRINL